MSFIIINTLISSIKFDIVQANILFFLYLVNLNYLNVDYNTIINSLVIKICTILVICYFNHTWLL